MRAFLPESDGFTAFSDIVRCRQANAKGIPGRVLHHHLAHPPGTVGWFFEDGCAARLVFRKQDIKFVARSDIQAKPSTGMSLLFSLKNKLISPRVTQAKEGRANGR
jgi:hypothetical protein